MRRRPPLFQRGCARVRPPRHDLAPVSSSHLCCRLLPRGAALPHLCGMEGWLERRVKDTEGPFLSKSVLVVC